MSVAEQQTYVIDELSRALARGAADLPTLPAAAAEALRLAQSSDMSFPDVVRVVEQDPALTARILSVANSPLYWRGLQIASLQQALVRLGIQSTRDVLYMAVYGSSLFKAGQYQARVQRVFEQAVLVARAARRVAALSRLDPDLAFLAGLLHDVGRARCYRILARRRLRRDPIEVEEAVEMLHAQAGAELAEAWNLPPAVAEACAHHAAPGPEQVMSRVVAIAADLVSVLDAHDPEGLVARGVLEKLAMLGVRDANVSSLIEDCRGDREQRGHSSPSFG